MRKIPQLMFGVAASSQGCRGPLLPLASVAVKRVTSEVRSFWITLWDYSVSTQRSGKVTHDWIYPSLPFRDLTARCHAREAPAAGLAKEICQESTVLAHRDLRGKKMADGLVSVRACHPTLIFPTFLP